MPGVTTDYRVWATRIESTAARELELDGSRQERIGRYRLRWFGALAEANLALSHELVVDGVTVAITFVGAWAGAFTSAAANARSRPALGPPATCGDRRPLSLNDQARPATDSTTS